MKLCLPLVIYLVLAVLSLAAATYRFGTVNNVYVWGQALIYIGVALLMYWACTSKHEWIAWVILLLPVILGVLGMLYGAATGMSCKCVCTMSK